MINILSTAIQFLLPNPEAFISYIYLFHRLKKSERIFIHKSLLVSLGVGNLVYVLDFSFFTTREENVVSKKFYYPLYYERFSILFSIFWSDLVLLILKSGFSLKTWYMNFY